jgi:PadR family transcriptional regulator, regulatory protein AphA
MSLRYGILDLLAGEPMSGYDLARFFSASMANVWPAQHSQIYPELAKLTAEGLIEQIGEGPRGRKVYQSTPAGVDALRAWMRETETDYSLRYEALLRVFCLWVLPRDEALEHVAHDRAEYVRHLGYIDEVLGRRDWAASPANRASRLAIEFGRRFYAMQIDWMDWAAEQISAGALDPGAKRPASFA